MTIHDSPQRGKENYKMSAFLVSYNHINAMLNAATQYQMRFHWTDNTNTTIMYDATNPEDAQTLGVILLRENVRSLCARYSQVKPEDYTDIIIAFRHVPDFNPYPAVQIFKACQYYDYQACESGNYKETFACRISDWIASEALSRLDGYNSAKWEIQ